MFKKKYHRFRIQIKYMKNNRLIFFMTTTLGVKKIKDIDNHRAIRKYKGKDFIFDLPKQILCNGIIAVEPLCYLGRW